MNELRAAVIGAGLAGCECALALAKAGLEVTVFEMKPQGFSPAHNNPDLAELVCSNSFRSDEASSAIGRLKEEMRLLGSSVMLAAEQARIPAGKALAVDRNVFSRQMTKMVEDHPAITVHRREVTRLDDIELSGFSSVIVSTGPLCSEPLSEDIRRVIGSAHLYFYDALAPIIDAQSLDMRKIFPASRYQEGQNDYLNCPLTRKEYDELRDNLLLAEKAPFHSFEEQKHFEACLPIETLAERGEMALAYGPFKPVGLIDPRTGERPFAVVQLRAENLNKSAFNLVGCQTKLTYGAQEKVFRKIPGLERAEFIRYGSMHRNTYVNAPKVLNNDLTLKNNSQICLAGQITGVEGYAESAACGLWVGLLTAARLKGRPIPMPPPETALGALLGHLHTEARHFQPSNVNYGLTPELKKRGPAKIRQQAYAERAAEYFDAWRKTWPVD